MTVNHGPMHATVSHLTNLHPVMPDFIVVQRTTWHLSISNNANVFHITIAIRILVSHLTNFAKHCQIIMASYNNVHPDFLHNSHENTCKSHEYCHELASNGAPWREHSATARAHARLAYSVTRTQNNRTTVFLSREVLVVLLIHMYCTRTRAGSQTVWHCKTVNPHVHTPGCVYMCTYTNPPGDVYMCTRHTCVPPGGPMQLPITTMANHLKPPKQRNYGIYRPFKVHHKANDAHVDNARPIDLQH